MVTEEKYYEYLTRRNKFSFLLRKILYKPIAKEFHGRILDVGCGIGEFLELYKNSYGIDMNCLAVKYCNDKGLKCSLGSAYKIPFKNNFFDGVLCSNVLEHLKRPEIALREFRRVLKKRGKLIIIVPTKSGYKRDKTHVKYWKESDLVDILKRYDFEIKKVTYYPFKINLLRDFYINELRITAIKQ
jgi:ubiquinone/menaquinone biosynthesis C-methylase UbiE